MNLERRTVNPARRGITATKIQHFILRIDAPKATTVLSTPLIHTNSNAGLARITHTLHRLMHLLVYHVILANIVMDMVLKLSQITVTVGITAQVVRKMPQ